MLACLIPAFFIAGAIAVFVSQAAVLKYFGAQAKRCWPIPWHRCPARCWRSAHARYCLFAGIYTRGEESVSHRILYSGPAINVLAIVFDRPHPGGSWALPGLSARLFSPLAWGLTMAFVSEKDDADRVAGNFLSAG
ncbi:MAG: hypothetical protein R2874_15475 [Desulfobacterales bacterium]